MREVKVVAMGLARAMGQETWWDISETQHELVDRRQQ